MKNRRLGYPRTDVERAMSHYDISEAEYYANPENYPLPERGTGLTSGSAAGSQTGMGIGSLIIIGLIVWCLIRSGQK